MRLVPLRVGHIDMALRIVTGEDGDVRLPVTSWLIDHPDGLVLFDTGMHPGLQTDVTRLGATNRILTVDYHSGEELAARLEEEGVRPSDIAVTVLSHLHFDHAGGCEQLPDTRLVVHREEWAAGRDEALVDAGVYDPVDYDHGHEIEQVDDGHDVFGDGRLVCVATPGHTAGHQALRVELASGPVVLTGDCVYFERMLEEMLVPRFGFDTDLQRTSMRRLAELRDSGCRLVYGHDGDQLAAVPSEGLR
ncbi:MAG: N-acyl homoserine lactonase family protein [Actinomycetota bacterium]